MKRSGALKRDVEKLWAWRRRSSKRIRPMSAKQQAFEAEFNRSKPAVYARSGGFCEARTSACTGFGEHYHHRAGRVGRGVNLPGMILHVCFACHRAVHANPVESYAQGWLVKRTGRSAA